MAISRKWAPLYGIILLLIVSNGIFFLLQSNLRQKPLFESFSYRVSDNVLTMFFLDDDQAIAATLGNDLVLRRDAGMEVTRVGVPSSIHDILHIPSRQEIMVGASNGVIYRYDHALNLIGEDKVPAKKLRRRLASVLG